jgi:purine-binding chemotaxis protein CheW
MSVTAKYVSFGLGGAGYCVPVENVVEIFRRESLLEVPKSSMGVKGVISLRGDVIPVVDLRLRFGMKDEGGGRRRRIIVVRHGTRFCGLLVDEVREILELEESSLPPGGPLPKGARPGLVCAIARKGGVLHLIVDLNGIFSQEREGQASGTPGAE